jgi:hypothetical protein
MLGNMLTLCRGPAQGDGWEHTSEGENTSSKTRHLQKGSSHHTCTPILFSCGVSCGVDGRVGLVIMAPISWRLPHVACQNGRGMASPAGIIRVLSHNGLQDHTQNILLPLHLEQSLSRSS